MTAPDQSAPLPRTCEVVIIGAGFGGLYMLHRLRRLGFDAHVVEAAGGVGGTWYWNRYPGARCDIESVQYSYSFDDELQQEWVWTERYAAQPEILRYAEHVADRFGLRSAITLNTRVSSTTYDEAGNSWVLTTDAGEQVTARYCIAAVGCLSTAHVPPWPGAEDFAGAIHHPGAWPHQGVDLTGQRVGVIGTGSSGIQITAAIAGAVGHLTVFQRTPTFTYPARNRLLSEEELAELKARYPEIRAAARRSSNGRAYATEGRPMLGDTPEQREDVLMRYWQAGGLDFAKAYDDVLSDPEADEIAASFVRARIAEIITDPVKRELLSPQGYAMGSRRPCLDTNYYASFNAPHVDVVDVRADPIVAFTPTGLRTASASFELDTVIVATGYDAMTGTLLRLNVTGRDGLTLAQAWADGPQTYLGVSVAGFPNFFVVAGPGSPSVLSNVILAIEQHVEWIADLLVHARAQGANVVEAEARAQQEWTRHVGEVAASTFLGQGRSWYLGDGIAGKPRVVMPYAGGTNVYRDRCEAVAADGYPGLVLRAHQPLVLSGAEVRS